MLERNAEIVLVENNNHSFIHPKDTFVRCQLWLGLRHIIDSFIHLKNVFWFKKIEIQLKFHEINLFEMYKAVVFEYAQGCATITTHYSSTFSSPQKKPGAHQRSLPFLVSLTHWHSLLSVCVMSSRSSFLSACLAPGTVSGIEGTEWWTKQAMHLP